MLRITADTNILVAGLNFVGGNPFRLLDLAREGKVTLAVSEAIMDEMADVLARKFDFSPADIAKAREWIGGMSTPVKPVERVDAVKADPQDNKILECAAASRSDYIVTGDRHLPALHSFREIPIVKVADFLEREKGSREL